MADKLERVQNLSRWPLVHLLRDIATKRVEKGTMVFPINFVHVFLCLVISPNMNYANFLIMLDCSCCCCRYCQYFLFCLFY